MMERVVSLGRWVKYNPARTFCLILLFTGLAAHFFWRLILLGWSTRLVLFGWYLPIAKGCGQGIKFIAALILLPVSRNLVTHLRSTWLRHIIPFDDNLTFHRLCGVLFLLLAWGHSLCHVLDGVVMSFQPDELWQLGFPEGNPYMKSGRRNYPSYWGGYTAITGYCLLSLMCIAYPFAMRYPRTALRDTAVGKVLNNHTYFWLTHHLLILPFYALLLCHPLPAKYTTEWEWGMSDTYLWVSLPLAIYLMERVVRVVRQGTWITKLRSVTLLPDNVMELRITKPKGFHYISGMYVFICCPEVSIFEWHPFTLTSAPEDEYLSVHIKKAGDWTGDLHAWFRKLRSSWMQCETSQGKLVCVPACRPTSRCPQQPYGTTMEPPGGGDVLEKKTDQPMLTESSQYGPAEVQPSRLTRLAHLYTGAFKPRGDKDDDDEGGGFEEGHVHQGPTGSATLATSTVPEPCTTGQQPLGASWRRLQSGFNLRQGAEDPIFIPSSNEKAPTIQVDGPYGAPTQCYPDYPVIVLIGAGIGITPMSSVCRSLLYQYNRSRCHHCGKIQQTLGLQKVFFFWTVREGRSMEWFQRILEQLVSDDFNNIFEVQIFITGGAATSAGQDSLALLEAAKGTSLNVRQGRPDWNELIRSIHDRYPHLRKGVFYCGNNSLGHVIRKTIIKLERTEKAKFEWHKEVF